MGDPVPLGLRVAAAVRFDLAEIRGEPELLFSRQFLIVEDHDVVIAQGSGDPVSLGRRQRLRQNDAG